VVAELQQILADPRSKKENISLVVGTIKKIFTMAYGSLKQSFIVISNMNPQRYEEDPDYDPMVNFLEWDHGLNRLGITLESRFSRNLYNMACSCHHKASLLTLFSFSFFFMQETLLDLGRTMISMERNKQRVRLRIQRFVEVLLHATVANRRMVAVKFQEKLSMDVLTKYTKRIAHTSEHARTSIDVDDAFAELKKVHPFQVYEEPVFKAVFYGLRPKVFGTTEMQMMPVLELGCALTLVSAESDPERKFRALFQHFDDDDDGCLHKQQIREMIQTVKRVEHIATRDPLAFESKSYFHSSLPDAAAERMFLQAIAAAESFTNQRLHADTLVSGDELWHAFQPRERGGMFSLVSMMLPNKADLTWAVQTKPFSRQVMEEVGHTRRRGRFLSTLQGQHFPSLHHALSEPVIQHAKARRTDAAPTRHLQRRSMGANQFTDKRATTLPPVENMNMDTSDSLARAIAVANPPDSDSEQEDPETLQISRHGRGARLRPLRGTAQMAKAVRKMQTQAARPKVKKGFGEDDAMALADVLLQAPERVKLDSRAGQSRMLRSREQRRVDRADDFKRWTWKTGTRILAEVTRKTLPRAMDDHFAPPVVDPEVETRIKTMRLTDDPVLSISEAAQKRLVRAVTAQQTRPRPRTPEEALEDDPVMQHHHSVDVGAVIKDFERQVDELYVEANYFGTDAVERHNTYMWAKNSMSEGVSKLWAKTFHEEVPYKCHTCGDVHDYQWGFELPPIKLGLQAKPKGFDPVMTPEETTRKEKRQPSLDDD
jgi:hypothetical protein